MSTLIDTSTASTATAYSNQRKVDRTSTGRLWGAFYNGTDTEFWYSDDDGATWTENTSATISGALNGSLRIDESDHAHYAYKKSSGVYYRRMASIGAGTSWSAETTVQGTSGSDLPDLAVHAEGSGWRVHVVLAAGTAGQTNYFPVTVTSAGAISVGSGAVVGGSYSGAAASYPSIDFNHTGDGKTVAGSTPHLYVAWSAGATGSGKGIRFKKATYSGGSWTWGTEREIDSTRYISGSAQWLNCLFDGTRVVIPGAPYNGTTTDVMLYERDAADTTTTTRHLRSQATGALLANGSATYDSDGNIYFVGRDIDGGVNHLDYAIWTRSSASMGDNVEVDAGTSATPYASVKRGYSNNLIEFIYTDGTSSPYNVTYDSITLNTAPNAPGSLSPDGTTIDRTATNRFSWTFSDPDTGDTQSAYDLRYRLTSSGTWTDVAGVSTSQFHDFAGSTFAAGDYEWQVRTYDAAGEVGPYSSSAFFTAGSPPSTPSITDPIAGQTIAAENYTVRWSAPSQSAYQVRTVADDGGGSPDTATVYQDTGEVTSSSARSRTMAFDTNGRDEHVQVRVKVSGLWSTWASVNVSVSYTAPATPTVTVDDTTTDGAILVQASHPTPSGSEPTVTSIDVHRRVTADGGDGTRVAASLAPTATFTDWAVASGVDYAYRVRAYGDNGTSAWSAWSEESEVVHEIVDGGDADADTPGSTLDGGEA